MRMIYSGKLLSNDAKLSSTLRKFVQADDDKEEPVYTLHAVLPLEKSTKAKYSHEVRAKVRRKCAL